MRYPENITDAVTGIVVHYNTPSLLKECIDSINSHYKINIIIIDGSPKGSAGNIMANHLTENKPNIRCINANYNIGHGKGINMGMSMVTTPLVNDRCLEFMLSKMETEERKYGCGLIVTTDENGCNTKEGIDYLHPYFSLIDREMFYKFPICTHHGAPMIVPMRALNGLNLLVNFDPSPYVLHHHRGTVRLRPKEFRPRTWDRI
jgi:hypothetical protein